VTRTGLTGPQLKRAAKVATIAAAAAMSAIVA
jgi:hypothetical protein